MRLSRASGLDGLAGMASASTLLHGSSEESSIVSGHSKDTSNYSSSSSSSSALTGIQRDRLCCNQPPALHATNHAQHQLNFLPGQRCADEGTAARAGSRTAILRPLLGISRQALRRVLVEQGVQWVEDPTNQDRSYSRNALRSFANRYASHSFSGAELSLFNTSLSAGPLALVNCFVNLLV